MKIRAILLFGSPGAGKGTQGKILGRIPNYLHVSSGELFRNLRVQNPLGQLFIDYASHGNLVPDGIKSVGKRQRTHRVEQRPDGWYVALDIHGDCESDKYAFREAAGISMERLPSMGC